MLVQALEEIWAITPDPRRDLLTVGFVTHLVSLATNISAAEISAPKRASHATVRARQLCICQAVTHTAPESAKRAQGDTLSLGRGCLFRGLRGFPCWMVQPQPAPGTTP